MNSKIILATSGMADTENLLKCIKDIVGNTQSMVIEANISDERQPSYIFPDTRSMQEARDRAYSNATNFEDTCIKLHVKYAARPQFDNYFFQDLIEDSRFADLIVCSCNLLLNSDNLYEVTTHVQSIVEKIECPLLVVPEKAENLMLMDLFIYDGTLHSIQAIKRFTYLFPERSCNELLILDRSDKGDELQAMINWLAAHFQTVTPVKEPLTRNQYNIISSCFDISTLASSHKTPVFLSQS